MTIMSPTSLSTRWRRSLNLFIVSFLLLNFDEILVHDVLVDCWLINRSWISPSMYFSSFRRIDHLTPRETEAPTGTSAFQLPRSINMRGRRIWTIETILYSSLSSKNGDEDTEDREDDEDDQEDDYILIPFNRSFETGRWQLTNDFQHFLTQCSVQSLLYLMVTALNDRHSALWLEEFTRPTIYHRSYAYDDQDRALETMATAYKEVMKKEDQKKNNKGSSKGKKVVSTDSDKPNDDDTSPGQSLNVDSKPIRLLNYHGIGAMNTTLFPTWQSYFELLLQQQSVTYEIETRKSVFTLDIDPGSLCRRILSVRAQISNEFVQDLDMIGETSIQQANKLQSVILEGGDDDYGDDPLEALDRFNLQAYLETRYDYDFQYRPSPLRKGNLDLLLTLTTQEAIHRILNRGLYNDQGNDIDSIMDDNANDDGDSTSSQLQRTVLDHNSLEYLQKFYSARLGTHFTGSTSRYNRATDFLDELLAGERYNNAKDMEGSSIDDNYYSDSFPSSTNSLPLNSESITIVISILQEREAVANEWLELSLDVPDQHMEIQKLQLDRQMMASSFGTATTTDSDSTGGSDNRDGDSGSSSNNQDNSSQSTSTSTFE